MSLSSLAPHTAPDPRADGTLPQPRGTYQVRTFGCQMNVHDSERLTGMLEDSGYVAAPADADARKGEVDVLVFNTCAVRENAANKLYGTLGGLRPGKDANPGMQIAVGGCLAQKDRAAIVERAPWVDVVFGTHNIGSLPVLLDRARHNAEAQVEILESLEVFPSTLPTRRESAYAAWVSISVGCNNTCTFCIVPSLRGKEKDRRPGDVLAEVRDVVDSGAIEVTLLGQNVNSYGVEFGDRGAFAKLLRACGEIDGLERVRFTSPHPAMFTDDVIDAMAETPNVMPQLHMPLQSGSDKVLRRMRRSYRSRKFLGILERVRERIPEAAITTDIIVGFPGETEDDFQRTLEVVEASRFSSAFTFQYSIRPGTPAATMDGQLPKEVVQERFERLIELQDRITFEENRALEGRAVEILVAEGEGARDAQTHRLSGRARDHRLVHFALPEGFPEAERPRPGDLVTATVTRAAPYYLIADSALGAPRRELGPERFSVRRTRSGDAWQAGELGLDTGGSCGTGGGAALSGPVTLGMPTLRPR
ncbi:tRNA-i(6)A37 methylthiotransferase [Brachybacterium faecium]|uniref:tRNA-2-methylthio-N(6)-dimethylallyladenosine synthase n=1 Tax=Brachybacterium faecium (strain ATCC 43885 / DSM 4810 / JCM 11609 / LMG 19847 / NBRC 14762 / NCIMB 9860 / 6-10) TaxID=446465 RepID=C7MBD0_BRAFD|nr:tRNA (N6-isopentenyl adenosine(37)-C2)-methylthiotransferase MiaB [Brachybacterium faecium]ACU84903.1 tRNA-i(6)A37 thiotransferase enzyme MiaB [Brachybacterium faecium DSM 4810]SLM97306.1 tRNA-i(6)A37 methylthiotransferase [Brachybacterium faecium]